MHKERTTLPRQWALLKALPNYPKKISIRQLWNAMEDLGYEVTKRTIERDLINLSLQFPIVTDDAKPAGWSIRSDDGYLSKSVDRLFPIIKPPVQTKTCLSTISIPQAAIAEGEIDEIKTLIQRFDPYGFLTPRPRHPDDFMGRQWLLKKVDDWLTTESSSLLWLQGPPGIGKTAFMSWLAEQRKTLIVATYYCHYQFNKSPEALARDAVFSLAVQLGRHIPAYRKKLLVNESLNRTALENHTATDLFDYLIIQPLMLIGRSKDINSKELRFVLLIDGLDEANTADGNNVLLENILQFAKSLPDAVSFIVSSRYDAPANYPSNAIYRLSLAADDQENHQDMCCWLNQAIPTELRKSQCNNLVEETIVKSDGLFLYLKLLQQDFSHYTTNPDLFPVGLDDFFTNCFNRYFPDLSLYSTRQRPLLELLISALEPVSKQTLCEVLQWSEHDCDEVIASFGPLFYEQPIDASTISFSRSLVYVDTDSRLIKILMPFHKALIDWLSDKTSAGVYRIIPQQGLQRWADSLNYLYQSNIQQLPEYALRHLPKHLALTGRHHAARQCLLNMELILRRSEVTGFYSNSHSVSEEYRHAHVHAPTDDALIEWSLFFLKYEHYLKKGHHDWPTARILLQLGAEQAPSSSVRQLVDSYIKTQFQGYWLRSVLPTQDYQCRVLDDQYAGLPPLFMGSNRVIGITKQGQITLWDIATGRCLTTMTTGLTVSKALALDDCHLLLWGPGENAGLSLWDINQEQCLLNVTQRGEIQNVCRLDNQRFVVSFEHFFVGVWDYSGRPCVSIENLTHAIGHIWPLENGYCLVDTHCACNGTADNLLLLWDFQTGQQIGRLRSYESHDDIQLIILNDRQVLTFTDTSDQFQIWGTRQGHLLATGVKQPGKPLKVLRNLSPIHITTLYDSDDMDRYQFLRVQSWLWDGDELVLQQSIPLRLGVRMEIDVDDQAACVCDSQLFDDGSVLLPSPLSLWSGLTGKKLADLDGSWSLGSCVSDFGSYYRRFNDGRLLTWSEPRRGLGSLATALYLWDKQGTSVREIVIDSLFSDVQIFEDSLFVTFNCDDTLQVWDASTGSLRQTIVGLGAKVTSVKIRNGYLLLSDSAGQLSLWSLASITPSIEQRHASEAPVKAQLFKDRILSYSLDSFAPRLWDANTGEWIAILPAYDSALGARLDGILPLSGERFLTWGNAPILHIYDSQDGRCLASMQDHTKPHIGRALAWRLQQDHILCLMWDQSLKIFDLHDNHFDAYQTITNEVAGAYPVSEDRVLYWLPNGMLRLWNVSTGRNEFDLLGRIQKIERIQPLSEDRLLIFAKRHNPVLLYWRSGKTLSLDWPEKSLPTNATALSYGRIGLWSSSLLLICHTNEAKDAPEKPLTIAFDKKDRLVFVTQLPSGELLTQVIHQDATLWSIWCNDTGVLINHTILPIQTGQCVSAQTVDQTVFLQMTDKETGISCYQALDCQDLNQIKFLPLHQIQSSNGRFALKTATELLGLLKGNWYFWSPITGSPIGVSCLSENVFSCEWYGQSMTQILGLTAEGRILGFDRKPVILQLYKGDQPVNFINLPVENES